MSPQIVEVEYEIQPFFSDYGNIHPMKFTVRAMRRVTLNLTGKWVKAGWTIVSVASSNLKQSEAILTNILCEHLEQGAYNDLFENKCFEKAGIPLSKTGFEEEPSEAEILWQELSDLTDRVSLGMLEDVGDLHYYADVKTRLDTIYNLLRELGELPAVKKV